MMKFRLTIVAFALLCIFSVQAEEPFVVKDIRIEGLQKISEGALLNYLPINIGDTLDEIKIKESIRAVYSSGFFRNIDIPFSTIIGSIKGQSPVTRRIDENE